MERAYHRHVRKQNKNRDTIELKREKKIVHKVPKEIRMQSIETLKVRKKTLEYLRNNGFKTINDIIHRKEQIPSEFRGNIYAYLIFGIED